MPLYRLSVSAETEGVVCIRPMRPRNWGLKVTCDACREFSPNFVYVDEGEECDSGGGGTRNAAFKCASCKTLITAHIDPESYGTYRPEEDNGKGDGNSILIIEVRGATPTELEIDDKWVVEAEGATFEAADLSTDWMEYDEKSGNAVSVSQFTVEFSRLKKSK
ncbi:hypothetical protein, conserved [Trypanosoma brucei gambiense DAL972]|uniref:Uncharacterized protein n=2 Tax=Trypanosoma brucei TaxID=5691 RepID=C9ZIQ7_TRYB9|nr:hypothetical protein, conserved [Trypanosoma brucei gambiense DAL972]RHW74319.1 hypothetical protein DPX39_010034900 [Trypanosoma brucei equiperdum]CBH09049.1 hypothetical protein, conserved [Trypanosoma brucei gambiense DAL972]|eukprot:XP_011771490.1 hypothetical protein, conserved [Trypanosoma brucei gambiense DAL972]